MDNYLINISVRADEAVARQLESEIRAATERRTSNGSIEQVAIDFGRDWMAPESVTRKLRAAANKLLTNGPPNEDE